MATSHAPTALTLDVDPAPEPVVKWAGGKRSIRRELLALAPRDLGVYHEPFVGGGVVFFSLAPDRAVLNDANPDLMGLYHALRDSPEAVMRELDRLQPHVLDPDFYYRVRASDPSTQAPPERAARFVYLNKTCYNGLYRVNRRGQFNVPFGRYRRPPRLYDRANLLRVAQLLRRADLLCTDFEEALEGAQKGDFVYLDPPYDPLSETANFTSYTRGSFSEADQRRLARVFQDLDARGCRVLLSNSDTPLIRDLYRGYRITEILAPRNINSDGSGRFRIPELAIRNAYETVGG